MIGKALVWISLIAMLMFGPLLGLAATQPVTNTRIYIDPPFVTGHPEGPDSNFNISIKIDNAKNVSGWSVDIRIAPLERVITPTAYSEGDFLKAGGTTYWVRPTYDKTNGIIHLGATLLGVSPGVSGDGTLATIDFLVLSAGECAIELLSTKLVDNTGELLPHNTYDGYYRGPTLNLVRVELSSHEPSVSEDGTLNFSSSVKNLGDVDLYARTVFELVSEEGKFFRFYSGQTFRSEPPPAEYLYVNEYIMRYPEYWNTTGTGPYLDAVGDGNYIWAHPDDGLVNITEWGGYIFFPIIGSFGFEDLDLAGRTVSQVTLEMYTQYPWGPDGDMDLDTYARNPPENAPPSQWVGSLWGTDQWGWHNPRWTTDLLYPDLFPGLATEAGINNFQLRSILYWTADAGNPAWNHGPAIIDCARLKIEFSRVSPLYGEWVVVPPEPGVFEIPVATWELLPQDVCCKYRCTAFAEYRYFPPPPPDFAVVIQRSRKTKTFKIHITP